MSIRTQSPYWSNENGVLWRPVLCRTCCSSAATGPGPSNHRHRETPYSRSSAESVCDTAAGVPLVPPRCEQILRRSIRRWETQSDAGVKFWAIRFEAYGESRIFTAGSRLNAPRRFGGVGVCDEPLDLRSLRRACPAQLDLAVRPE